MKISRLTLILEPTKYSHDNEIIIRKDWKTFFFHIRREVRAGREENNNKADWI